MYFSKNGKILGVGDRDITSPVNSNAKNLDEIISELKITKVSEGQVDNGSRQKMSLRIKDKRLYVMSFDESVEVQV